MPSPAADLILESGNVITCSPTQPRAEAVAIKGSRILRVGSNDVVREYKNRRTRTVNCQNQTVVPGFIDAHCHILALARSLGSVDLSPFKVRSIPAIQTALRAEVDRARPGDWIRGVNYSEFYLAEQRHPTRFDLDEVSPHNPVILFHRSMHACVLNTLALSLVGIGMETPEPESGLIERDLETGQPNGLLFEMLDYVGERISASDAGESQLLSGLAEADRHYLSHGITSMVDASVNNDLASWEFFHKLKQAHQLTPRLNLMFGFPALNEFVRAGMSSGYGDENLRLGSLKIVLTETRGRLQPSQDDLEHMVFEAARHGFPSAVHAVEYSTVSAAIQAFEAADQQAPAGDLRQRLEHCSECPPDLLARLRELGMIIVSQPTFLYFSGERYLSQVPVAAQPWLYPFKSWLAAGLKVAGSSDSPVVPANPLLGIYAAASRRAESGQLVRAEQAITLEQALQLYTRNAAYSTGEERLKGSLEPGKLADIAVLDGDPLDSLLEKVKDIRVEMTVLGGEVVWEMGEL